MQMSYAEVQEINRVLYRSMHTATKVDKKWLPVTARVIPGVAFPLLVGMNFRDGQTCRDRLIISTPLRSSSFELVMSGQINFFPPLVKILILLFC